MSENEHANLYREAVELLWRMGSIHGSAALVILEEYINGALIQRHRIEIDRHNLFNQITSEVNRHLNQKLILDIHFYFICLDKCRNLFKLIARMENDSEIEDLWNRYQPQFQFCRVARNHLEHIEDRISNKRYLVDLGNSSGDSFTFGGMSFDISKSALSIFTRAYEHLLSILKNRPNRINV